VTARPVELSPAAALEVREANAWYRLRDPAVATQYRRALFDARQRIGETPEVAPVWDEHETHEPVRKLVVRGFPYLIFYVVQDTRCYVLAVAHASRRPGYWLATSPP